LEILLEAVDPTSRSQQLQSLFFLCCDATQANATRRSLLDQNLFTSVNVWAKINKEWSKNRQSNSMHFVNQCTELL